MGTGFQEMVAFLRWMGIYKDKLSEASELGMDIKKIVLSFDFDEPGATIFVKRKELFQSEFPEVEVTSVHEYLPDDIRRILPEFDPKIFAEGKEFFGFKLDLNDILKRHKPTWASENGISADLAQEIEKLRLKYAYIPN
jgi:hypothetical protein